MWHAESTTGWQHPGTSGVRALSGADLDRWRSAVMQLLPGEVGTVLDLGAGTGIFSRAWADWGAGLIVAGEPSREMRREARRHRLPPNVVLVAARAETIPLASWCADVVWLSTVVHHIADLPAAAAEIHRVLAPEGRLLVRNLFADLGTTPWLNELPGADRARHVFPTVHELAEQPHVHGLQLIATVEVAEQDRHRSAKATAAWVRSMRNADTLLLAFTDDEIAAGLERLDSHPANHTLEPSRIGLAAFRSAA